MLLDCLRHLMKPTDCQLALIYCRFTCQSVICWMNFRGAYENFWVYGRTVLYWITQYNGARYIETLLYQVSAWSNEEFSKGYNAVNIWWTITSKICTAPNHGLTIYQVSAWSDVKCKRSYREKKTLQTDGQTDAEWYNIIQLFSNGDIKMADYVPRVSVTLKIKTITLQVGCVAWQMIECH